MFLSTSFFLVIFMTSLNLMNAAQQENQSPRSPKSPRLDLKTFEAFTKKEEAPSPIASPKPLRSAVKSPRTEEDPTAISGTELTSNLALLASFSKSPFY
jgi:hypothetical protein